MLKKMAWILAVAFLVLPMAALAQTQAAPTPSPTSTSGEAAAATTAPGGVRWGAIGAAFLLGIAAAFGAMAQGRATAAACDGMSRNPGAVAPIRLMAIIGLALIESLVLYALVIANGIKGL